jgi:MFS/sugar transport protein
MRARPITTGDTASYAMGSFGTGVFSTVPAVLLLYFCTETLHIAGTVAAALILIPKIWSILWDPFVGRWSDWTCARCCAFLSFPKGQNLEMARRNLALANAARYRRQHWAKVRALPDLQSARRTAEQSGREHPLRR